MDLSVTCYWFGLAQNGRRMYVALQLAFGRKIIMCENATGQDEWVLFNNHIWHFNHNNQITKSGNK